MVIRTQAAQPLIVDRKRLTAQLKIRVHQRDPTGQASPLLDVEGFSAAVRSLGEWQLAVSSQRKVDAWP
jgi:hypothetical protein